MSDMRLNPKDIITALHDNEILAFAVSNAIETQKPDCNYSRFHHRHYKTGGWFLKDTPK